MFPPVLSKATHGILPELRNLALHVHDRMPDPDAIPGGGSDSHERRSYFDLHVKGDLDQGFYHNVEESIRICLSKYKFLNSYEIKTILDATTTLDEECHDIRTCLDDSEHLCYYTRLMLRSQDPDVVQHHDLLNCQYKKSRKACKALRKKLREYRGYIMLLWGMMAQEIKRTCDIEDAAANEAEPEVAAPPYAHTP